MTARYVARRLAQVLPAVAGVLLIGFLLIQLAPGDPILALAGESGDAEYYEFMRQKFGLDRPLPDQLWAYFSNVIRGDLGVSYVHGRSVAAVIGERLPATVLLTSAALVLSSIVGIGLGIYGGLRYRHPDDLLLNVTALSFYAAPVFWVGQLALLTLALGLGWFPVQGMTTAGASFTGFAAVRDVAAHLALPALVLAAQEIAAVTRLTRVGLINELASDHVRTARGKGLAERIVIVRHGLRRTLLPVVTVIGGRIGHLVSGAVVVELVFGWPGLGRLLVGAMQNRDTPILLGMFLLVATSVIIANLLTDLVYGWLDPRIRLR